MSGIVELRDYDPRWSDLFELASAELTTALGGRILCVYHVGSTAVPGLCAKPSLDILVSVPRFEGDLEALPILAALGYEYRPDDEIRDRHYFSRKIAGEATHHLSLAEPASRYHNDTIAFRDALRNDRHLASAYAELKRQLRDKFPTSRVAYLDGKSQFIRDVLNVKRARDGAA